MRRVLMLDDEPSVLGVLSEYLCAPGIEVVTCREIEAAEALLTHGRFDVVISDLRVSELGGLEGMRLIRHVATHFPQTVVLAMSGYVNEDVKALGFAAGASAILEKPIDLRRLMDFVHGPDGAFVDDSGASGDDGVVRHLQPLSEFLDERSLRAVLQPIVTLDAGSDPFEAHAVESLVRAPSDSPLRNPEILFAYASRKEMLFETDMLAIEAALEAMAHLEEGPLLFINTQPRSMTNDFFADRVTAMANAAEVDSRRIVFELTEQQTILNPQAFAATLNTLRDRGFGVALDDFGVGFANLQLVQDLRPDYLKISGYFTNGIVDDAFQQTLVRSVAQMCEKLGIPTILENIETAAELEIVRTLGITHGQGYFFARPQPGDVLAADPRFCPPHRAGTLGGP